MAVDHTTHIINAERAKSLIMKRLVNDGIIDPTTAEVFDDQYHFIMVQRKWYKKWWDKVRRTNPQIQDAEGNEYEFMLIKFQ